MKDYAPDNVFNADETALFYKMTPNHTLALKGEKCIGGKKSKERITAMLCCNATGTEKLPPLIIGKYGRPRCFKGVQSLPCEYNHNQRAWMTGEIFHGWLLALERKMKASR